MKNGLTINEAWSDGVHVLTLSGFLDGHTFVEIERKLDALIKAGKNRIAVDLSGLNYIASAGVGAFINGQHLAKKAGGGLEIGNASTSVREIFDILGLEAIFTIHETMPEAIKAARA